MNNDLESERSLWLRQKVAKPDFFYAAAHAHARIAARADDSDPTMFARTLSMLINGIMTPEDCIHYAHQDKLGADYSIADRVRVTRRGGVFKT